MNPVEEKVLEGAQVVDIEKLEKLDINDLSKIRRNRIAALRKDMEFKEEWITNEHGQYTSLQSVKEFLVILKKSDRVVLHCYHSSTMRCEIVDKHLDLLAKRHLETKFCKLDVEKAHFLCERLKINVIPTILLCTGTKNIELIVGFDDFGGVDDFPTEMMEWHIAKAGLIRYDGDLTSPPNPNVTEKPKRSIFTHVKKNIGGSAEGRDAERQGDH